MHSIIVETLSFDENFDVAYRITIYPTKANNSYHSLHCVIITQPLFYLAESLQEKEFHFDPSNKRSVSQ